MKKFLSYLARPGTISLIIFLCFAFVLMFQSVGGGERYLPQKDNGYEITNYDIVIDVDQNKSMQIKEEITVNFNESSRGIYRYIPIKQTVTYLDKNDKKQSRNYRNTISEFKITNDSADKIWLVDHDNHDGYAFYAMGNTNRIFYGAKTFKFEYKINPGNDRDTIEDVYYYNIIGTGWDTDIQNVNFTIKFPTNVDAQQFKFYVGQYGEDGTGDDARLTYSVAGDTVTGHCVNLGYGEAITTYTIFEEGYFKFERSYIRDIVLLVIFLATMALLAVAFVLKRRKSPLVEVVEFVAPKGLTPTEAGYINDGQITGDDISALVVYWASKGCIKIIEDGGQDVIIKKIKELPDNAKAHEKKFFKALFADTDEVISSELNSLEIGKGALACKREVEKDKTKYFDTKAKSIFQILCILTMAAFTFQLYKMISQSYISTASAILCIVFLVISGVAITNIDNVYDIGNKLKKSQFITLLCITSLFAIGPLIALSVLVEPFIDPFFTRIYLILLPALLLLIYPLLEKYTEEGKKNLGRIKGLKNYIEVAEKDKLQMLVDDNPEAFFEILPFAYVLGVSKVYMEKFKDVDLKTPEWLEGNSLETWVLINHLDHSLWGMSKAVNNSGIYHNTPPSTGGFGGGGFSGGSFGGGGGGFSGGGSGGGGGGRF